MRPSRRRTRDGSPQPGLALARRGRAAPLRLVASLSCALALAGCDAHETPSAPQRTARVVPASMQACVQCHARIVESYLAHGMSDSLGPLDTPPAGALVNATTGTRYEFRTEAGVTTLTATRQDGGVRRQDLVGRLGAGIMDMSFAGAEIDPVGRRSGRLFFTPVERVTGFGLALAPFELDSQPAGLDQPLAFECLGCHTSDGPAQLPGAALARGGQGAAAGGANVYPRHALGADAFEHLHALGCSACHGSTHDHVDLMRERVPARGDDIGIARLGELPLGQQRDVCARCHLEGEAHLALRVPAGDGPQAEVGHAARAVLVPAHPGDDFRFVSQVERLALSACFRKSPAMTCTSCHVPHTSVAAEGVAAFDRACIRCHAGGRADCTRPETLQVRDVTGSDARTADGCVDCHVRRSQPFDLPHVVSADHWVRSRIPRPSTLPMRHAADPDGPLAPFDDGRLREALDTEGGRAWARGLVAAGLFRLGRNAEAAALVDAPASAQVAPPLPPELVPLEQSAALQHVRGLILEAAGRTDEAREAYDAALALDPSFPESRLNRALLRISAGATEDGLADAELLLALYPQAERAWNLRALAASRAGNVAAAAAALIASTQLWGSDAAVWQQLGGLLARMGQEEQARTALREAARLAPSLPGLQEDLATRH